MSSAASSAYPTMHTTHGEDDARKKFELPGSRPHYPPSLLFTITHMRLAIEPDLQERSISCEQKLSITILHDTDTIELDAAELQIKSVSAASKLEFRSLDDKLAVKLGRIIKEGSKIELAIAYSAKPRQGFYFVAPDKHYPDKHLEAWTQGETTQAKHWFPCIDHPQVKFSSEISVTVQSGFTAISNGRLQRVEQRGNKKQVFHWLESNPHPAYLASVVVGKYAEIKDGSLQYYVPPERKADAPRTFDQTPKMIKFFEEYLGTKYPYEKYAQVAVQDFIYGGMENSSCTTLTLDTLHDKKAHVDFTSDYLISHELAHQWFGDLVTCRDWQHIWLNEGFATYCEALYWEASRGNDEFQYYVMQTADDYFEEAGTRYTRPIVTKVYKHPDDLFDRHTYEKGGCVLHMLRHHVGDKYFRRSLKTYLQRFANSTAETDDLRKIFELETGKSLQQFFDQWIFREGHPELKVDFSQDGDIAKIKVEQVQAGDPFEFALDVNLAFARGKKTRYTFKISEKESVFQIPVDSEVEWFSVDPEFKILKTISIRAPKEMLVRQLRDGDTVIERVEAARALKDKSSDAVIDALKDAVLHDKFWGVAAEAAKALGAIRTDYAYEALKGCLLVKHPKARRAVVKAIGEFKKEETLELLKPVLQKDESYFVESEAATAIGKTKSRQAIAILKKAAATETFQNVVAQGAIAGLKEFAGDKDIADFLVEKSKYGNYHRVREAATFALGKFADNHAVFDHLKSLLTDRWFRVRINACRALADAELTKAIPDLTWVAEHDLDHRVRRVADECINIIKEATKKPKEVAQMREELDRVKSKNLELLQKVDRLERELR
ncbi:M1 family aminopeptidase [Candidatus Nitrososphaera gargensis]|uniref:M1 family aminopeptidase n=1 Tax=Candidatus Nitrososphaera gargensis TaxID=497727 RepID=UPI0016500E24|nr:M1 family aminopeptidase [Candidatus Nitrososphaera gargensis]